MSESTSESRSARSNGIGPPVSGQRRQFTDDYKRAVIARVKKGESAWSVATELNISGSVVKRWVDKGVAKPKKSTKPAKSAAVLKGVSVGATGRKSYSEEFQRAAVKRWQSGKDKVDDLCDELKIHSSQLYSWKEKFGTKRVAKASISPYTDEFKRKAVMQMGKGKSSQAISAELGISNSSLHLWANQERKGAHGDTARESPAPAVANAHGVKDAISFLKHAKTEMHEALRRGEIKEFDQAHLLSQLALNALLKSA
jgi:transposase-like protein